MPPRRALANGVIGTGSAGRHLAGVARETHVSGPAA
jgi:hypothetical protein